MPNVVDQRLASRFHLWQIAVVERSEQLAARVGRVYENMMHHAILGEGINRRPQSYPEAMAAAERIVAQAQADARTVVEQGLAAEITRAHRLAVDVLVSTIPLAWFAPRHQALAWLAVLREDDRSAGSPVDFDYEYEPIVPWRTNPQRTRQQAMDLIRRYLFPPPSASQSREWLTYSIGGLTWDDRFRRYDAADRQTILSQLTSGISQGENVSELRERLLPVVNGTVYRAQRIARTEGRRVAELAQQAAVDSLGDLIGGMQIIATMDMFTRPEHAARNGKVYHRQPDGSYVANDGQRLPQLPDEPNCRCWATPVLAPPEEFLSDPAWRQEFQTATAATIPDPATYSQWFARATTEQRYHAVGARRYETMARTVARRPVWEEFIDENGRLLSPAQIQAETTDDRAARVARVQAVMQDRENLFRQVYGRGFLSPPAVLSPPPPPLPRGPRFTVPPEIQLRQPAAARPDAAATQARIRSAYAALAGGGLNVRVYLADLRRASGLGRAEFDAAMLAMERAGTAVLYPLDNPMEIRPEDERAGLPNSAGFVRHIVYMG